MWRTTVKVSQQLGSMLLTLLIISMLAFFGTSGSGENVARSVLGREATQLQLDAYIAEHSLDDPLIVRYGRWLGSFVLGDWGVSPQSQRPVINDIWPRAENTLILALVAMVIATVIGLLASVYMAQRIGKPADTALLTTSIVIASMPEFVVAFGLVMIFGVWLGWLPVDSTAVIYGTPPEVARAYILPALALALTVIPYVLRVGRVAMAETLMEPYARSAILQGLSRRRVLWINVLPNASGPIINAISLNLVYVLGGVIIVENVFGFPGIGQALVAAINSKDTNSVLAITMLLGILFILLNLLTDFVAVLANPRSRNGGKR
ncbi:ABC transporter permease [Leucobacter soli]|uniref:ABC transporter permease n=1 Tax=Leucobacter soli TaxID=2812850 RepID=UPI0036116616